MRPYLLRQSQTKGSIYPMEIKDIGDAFRRARTQVGLSQRRVADELGIDQGNVSRLETGRHGLTLENIVKLSDIIKSVNKYK